MVRMINKMSSKSTNKNTATIQDMINAGAISENDQIEFTFKGNTFYAKVLRGGLIGQCKIKRAYSSNLEKLPQFVSAFSSLTAWTEAMLQDVLEEYYTRYSSWKRVTHSGTKRSMSDLRDQCKLYYKEFAREENVELFKEILYLHNVIKQLVNGQMALPPSSFTVNNPPLKKQKTVNTAKFDISLVNKTQELLLHQMTINNNILK